MHAQNWDYNENRENRRGNTVDGSSIAWLAHFVFRGLTI